MSKPRTANGSPATDWPTQERLLMREVMKLVGRSLPPAFVLREILQRHATECWRSLVWRK